MPETRAETKAEARPVRVGGVVERGEGEALLLEPPLSLPSVRLNASARAIWELCDGERTVEGIADELAGELELPPGSLLPDVAATVGQLEAQRLVTLDLRILEAAAEPFPYFRAEDLHPPGELEPLLDWFEGDAPWYEVKAHFYEQFEFDVRATEPPAACAGLFSPAALERLGRTMAAFLAARIDRPPRIIAHKLVPGQKMGIHNDAAGTVRHRFVLQLSRRYEPGFGGHLRLFRSRDPEDLHRVVLPHHNTGLGFSISERSWHDVTEIRAGERYTVVYSF